MNESGNENGKGDELADRLLDFTVRIMNPVNSLPLYQKHLSEGTLKDNLYVLVLRLDLIMKSHVELNPELILFTNWVWY